MKRRLQEAEDKALGNKISGRIRVLERLGRTVKETIANPTPWKSDPCGRQCRICQVKPGACKTRGVVYEIHCLECKEKGLKSLYIGETHRTMWDRIGEHFSKLESGAKDSALLKHWRAIHQDTLSKPRFSAVKVGSYRTSTERQIREAIRIDAAEYDHLLNSKSEWGQNAIPRQATTLNDEIWEKPNMGKKPQEEDAPNGDKKRVPQPEGPFESQYSQRRKRLREEKQGQQIGATEGMRNGRHHPQPSLKKSERIAGGPPQQPGHGRDGEPHAGARMKQVQRRNQENGPTED